jgi:hypothetical protein
MAIDLRPTAFKYQINEEFAGKDKYWSTKTDYEDLLFAHGQHVKDYADISHIAKGLAYSKLGITESTALSPLFEYVTGDGGVEIVDKNFVRWRIYGQPERRAISFGNLNTGEYTGANGIPFKLFLDVDWYKESDLLAPVRNKRCVVRIVSERAVPIDSGFQYEVVLVEEDDAAFVPEEYFTAGDYWLKVGAATSWENIGTTGSIQFGEGFSYIEWQVPLTTMAWEFEISGEAHRQYGNLEIARCDDEGRPIPSESRITNYHEARALAQIDYEKELFLTYGSKTEHLIDRNTGDQITTGPGIFAYLEEGNVMPYSPETQSVDFIAEQIEALWFDRVPTQQRELLLLTGQAGLKIFNEWVTEKFGNTAATFGWDFVLQTRRPFDVSSGRRGFAFSPPQFVEYQLPTFGNIKIAHWPLLDNTRIHGVTYPGSIYPVSSYEFIAFNIGFGEPNVKFLSRSDNKIQSYYPGLWSPLGATGQDNPFFKIPAYWKESYKWMHRESFGAVVADVSTTLFFKPNITY